MGQTAENVVQTENVTRQEMDEFAALSQQRAVANVENGFFEQEITPLTLPDGTVVSKDDGPRAGTTAEGWRSSSRCSAPTARSRPATPARSTTAPPP
jgi:acetyl-CoA C-acetyltransferase